jgi:hypothetical protein
MILPTNRMKSWVICVVLGRGPFATSQLKKQILSPSIYHRELSLKNFLRIKVVYAKNYYFYLFPNTYGFSYLSN